ncbi:MAG: alpha/beta fold hydrolase [Alphaproteobacteria bacterium]|nr:alpha/beta fold hydrolase [Alphaproteobacteria bacterium]
MADPRVAAAISHWAPRFVANGITLTDFQEVTGAIRAWSDWCARWSERADIHAALGREALVARHFVSAAEHLSRAAVTYHFAKFLFVDDMAQLKAAHMKAVECHKLALPHLAPPGEYVRIPYQGKHLAAVLRKPAGAAGVARPERSKLNQPPPVVVMVMGLDSAKEEMIAYQQTFLARGLATLTFDGPGQGEAEYDFPIRGDYEVAVKAVIDWLESRRDVNAARVGLWGVSLGGYYAPRAAAFERRVKACIALAGPYDWFGIWDRLPEITRAAFRVRSHAADEAAARKNAAALSLKGIAHKIECPIFIVSGRLDRIVPSEEAGRLAAEVKGPCELLIIPDGNHVANNRPYRYRPQTADWMAAQLGAGAG